MLFWQKARKHIGMDNSAWFQLFSTTGRALGSLSFCSLFFSEARKETSNKTLYYFIYCTKQLFSVQENILTVTELLKKVFCVFIVQQSFFASLWFRLSKFYCVANFITEKKIWRQPIFIPPIKVHLWKQCWNYGLLSLDECNNKKKCQRD